MQITAKDRELLALLRVNAREPVASLARKLGTSRTTIQDRLARLEKSGAIAGYSVRLSDEIEKGGIRAHVNIAAEPRRAVDVARALMKMPDIEMLHTVSGKFDIIALVRTAHAEDMDRMLDQVGAIPGVLRIETAIVLSTKLDRRQV